jgi:spermidine synthase
MYDSESATYAAIFGDFFNLRAGNRVIIAGAKPLPDETSLTANAMALGDTLAPFGIDVERELQRFSRVRDWNEDAAVLSD